MGRPLLLSCLLVILPLGTAQAVEPIPIGLTYPRTGNYKAEGLELNRGALLAVDVINSGGGVLGRPLELLGENSASRKQAAERNIEKFAQLGVTMAFGGATSDEAIAAGKRARELGMLYFATLSYANDVTGSQGQRYLFRESNSAWMSAKVLGEYLTWHMPRRRYHYIVLDDTWGRSTESALRTATSSQDRARNGYSVIPAKGAHRADYLKALQKAAASEADMLVIVLLGDDLMRTMRLASNLGLSKKMQIIVPNLSKSIVQEAGPSVMAGVIGTEAWTWRVPEQEKSPEGQTFVDAYIAQHREYPGSSAASAYSIVRQWADAVQRSGSLDSGAVIASLENHSYRLLKDEQQWRAFDHQNVQSIYAVKVKSRNEIMRSPLKQDYFDIIHRMDGEAAAPSLDDWQQERGDNLTLQ
ncbi:branched-chain amino acid ABC transporter substrate-binding protein [Pseudomonas cavernicola]|uniref:Branched-chain amino acid ABC transporter substrate-binding protein n=1 Tax=Pseudomonas cavernicola TaxID=2320866 RepID=A0A418X864_9PSED|nr:ABC transporter substrate-binding protein [Pseudomonas cavernicola]RJG08686.1 branched-chain amino acid ABC transporter substrate-binding protein [Pseudomonas cavernicola]